MKNIKVLELGGTISAKGTDRLDYKDYKSGIFSGEDFLARVPELEENANVKFETFLQVSSTAITSAHWLALRKQILITLEEDNFDGIVITQGTNTIEETAYFLHLTLPTDKPVVVTGAQKPFTALSTDADNNLLQAIRVAASEEAIQKGVLVVLNEEINSARDVTKGNTYRLEAFHSGQLGYMGFADPDGRIVFYREPTRTHTSKSAFASLPMNSLPEVAIIYSHAGANGDLIRYITASEKYAGIVTAGTGAGLIAPDELTALEEAAQQGLHIVRSSRVGNGRVLRIVPYEAYPFISADNLSPHKARILLMLSLLTSKERADIQHFFDEY